MQLWEEITHIGFHLNPTLPEPEKPAGQPGSGGFPVRTGPSNRFGPVQYQTGRVGPRTAQFSIKPIQNQLSQQTGRSVSRTKAQKYDFYFYFLNVGWGGCIWTPKRDLINL